MLINLARSSYSGKAFVLKICLIKGYKLVQILVLMLNIFNSLICGANGTFSTNNLMDWYTGLRDFKAVVEGHNNVFVTEKEVKKHRSDLAKKTYVVSETRLCPHKICAICTQFFFALFTLTKKT